MKLTNMISVYLLKVLFNCPTLQKYRMELDSNFEYFPLPSFLQNLGLEEQKKTFNFKYLINLLYRETVRTCSGNASKS